MIRRVLAVWARMPVELDLDSAEALVHWTLATSRSKNPGSFGGARKAMLKSCAEEGEEGVTIIAGSGDFSDTSGRDRSKGAGMRV